MSSGSSVLGAELEAKPAHVELEEKNKVSYKQRSSNRFIAELKKVVPNLIIPSSKFIRERNPLRLPCPTKT